MNALGPLKVPSSHLGGFAMGLLCTQIRGRGGGGPGRCNWKRSCVTRHQGWGTPQFVSAVRATPTPPQRQGHPMIPARTATAIPHRPCSFAPIFLHGREECLNSVWRAHRYFSTSSFVDRPSPPPKVLPQFHILHTNNPGKFEAV